MANSPLPDSGCPWAAQRPGRSQQGPAGPAKRQAHELPRVRGAAELAGAPRRGRLGVKLPGPFLGDRLGHYRCTRASLLMTSTMCTGIRIVRAWSAMARVIACQIHHVA